LEDHLAIDVDYAADGMIRETLDPLSARGRYRVRAVSQRTPIYLGSAADWTRFRFAS
jgi:hypothetical protein